MRPMKPIWLVAGMAWALALAESATAEPVHELQPQQAVTSIERAPTRTSGARDQLERQQIEAIVRNIMPAPLRCETNSQEPIFWCRHQTTAAHGVALELAVSDDGVAASLTYDFDDPQSRQLISLLKGFFSQVGIEEKHFDDCINRSVWESDDTVVGNMRLACRHCEIGDRKTYEVVAGLAR